MNIEKELEGGESAFDEFRNGPLDRDGDALEDQAYFISALFNHPRTR
jgi:hypothetical protein